MKNTDPYARLPVPVAQAIRAFGLRKDVYAVLRLVASTAAIYLFLLLVATHIDRFSFLTRETRTALTLGAHAIAGIWLVAQVAVLLFRRPTPAALAYEMESRLGTNPEERIVTLQSVVRDDIPDARAERESLLNQLAEETTERLAGVSAGGLARDRRLVRWAAAAGALLLVCGALMLPAHYQFPLMVERFLFPGRNLAKPSFIRLDVQPEEVIAGRGGEVVLRLELEGEIPAVLEWFMREAGMSRNRAVIAIGPEAEAADAPFRFGRAERIDMSRADRDLFVFSKADLQEGFRFQIRCGDGQTSIRRARVVAQPRIVEATLRAVSPEYAALEPVETDDLSQSFNFLPETKVEVTFRTDQDVPVRELRAEDAEELPDLEWDAAARTGRFRLVMERELDLELVVTNEEGFRNVKPFRIRLGLREDQAPAVKLTAPPPEIELVAGEMVFLRGEVEDDLGLQELVLTYRRNPGENPDATAKEAPLDLEVEGEKRVEINTPFNLEETGAAPGDTVVLSLRARDTADNDQTSGDITIRVVPFTRGGGERRRLLALEALAGALPDLAPPEDAADPSARLAADPWSAFVRANKGQDLPVDEAARLDSLLAFLEREQHYTERPRHKAVVRMLYVVLADAWRRAADRAALTSLTADLGKRVLPGLVRYRQAKNVCFRLFGMRTELLRIRQRMQELNALEEPDEQRETAVKRRAQLYLETLQDVGAEVLVFARTSDSLDEETLGDAIGELNTSAYSMRRGSLARRLRAADEVSTAIAKLIRRLRPTFRPLFEREDAARARLVTLYEAALTRLAPDPLLTEIRMLDRNPVAAAWPRVRNRLLSLAAEGRADAPPQPLPAAVSGAVRAETTAAGAVAFDWERARVREQPRLAPAEKTLELLLLGVEEAALAGTLTDAAADRVFGLVEALDPVDTAGPDAIDLPARPDAGGRPLLAARETIRTAARETWNHPDPMALLDGLRERLADVEKKTRAFLADVKEEEWTKAAASLDAMLAAYAAEARHVDDMLFSVRTHATALTPPTAPDPREAWLLVILASERYRRLAPRLDQQMSPVRAAAKIGVEEAEFVALADQAALAERVHASFSGAMDEMAEAFAADEAPTEQTYTIVETFAHAEQAAGTLIRMLDHDDPAALAGEFLEAWPDDGLVWVGAQAVRLQEAAELLGRMDDALQAEPFERDAYTPLRARAEALLADLVGMLRRFPDTEWKGSLLARLEALHGRVRRLKLAEAIDAAGRVRVRVALVETRQALEDEHERMLQSARETEETAESRFRGGPAGVEAKAARRDADRIRGVLLEQLERARREIAGGILSAFEARPDPARLRRALSWSFAERRMIHSAIYGDPGRERDDTRREGAVNPHEQWLLRNIQKALEVRDLEHYEDATEYYLNLVRDFIKY